jgi:transcriptional regulator with XRE-family HTH domain
LDAIDVNINKLIEALKAKGTIRFDTDFCEEIGIRKGNLWNIRNGNAHFTVDHIHRICEAYGANPAYIFGFSDDMFIRLIPIWKETAALIK